MPKATLVSGEGNTLAIRFGSKLFEFINGKQVEVSVAVALILQDMVGKKKRPLFEIVDMPNIVEAVRIEPSAKDSGGPRQLQF